MELSAAMILQKFFGRKEGQTLVQFNDELKALSAAEKAELAEAAAKAMGVEVAKAA